MRLKNDGIPVLFAVERNSNGHLAAWCPFCRTWHLHGSGEGHRVAHCSEGSPFIKTGYYIVKVKPPKE